MGSTVVSVARRRGHDALDDFISVGRTVFCTLGDIPYGFRRRGADKSRRGAVLFVCGYRSVCGWDILRVVRDEKVSRRVEKYELVSGYV